MKVSNQHQLIAVVGMGALFPDAPDIGQFWKNICSKKVSIRPLPDHLFESEIYFRPDLLTARDKKEKSVTNIAAWIENLAFDTVRKYKIPPSIAEHMDHNQHAALYTADEALRMHPLKEVAKDRVAVILGNGMVGVRYGDALARVQFEMVEHYLRQSAEFQKLPADEQKTIVDYVRAHALKDSIPISEDSAPGVLPNIIAARIASVYDFNGPSYTVDAACASVLAAMISGIQGLTLGEYDAVICGGADMPLKQLGFIYFSALNALSPDGSFPFDKRANGFVMGQGAGSVILKRLEDAIKNKDTIYAVITGYGEASDGKGKYIAAPNEDWQARTIEKACRMAGYPVDTIEMIEAHGTATIVGDVVEVNGLKKAFASLGSTRKNYCGLTSVKSNIGHLKSAAGIAGFLKAVLALHHKMLPPTANFREINPKLQIEDSPFYILDELREWPAPKEHPRRANVSAFGFGGADYHIAMQEYREEDYRSLISSGFTPRAEQKVEVEGGTPVAGAAPANHMVFFSADSLEDLKEKVGNFTKEPDLSFSEWCLLHNFNVSAAAKVRLALLAASPEEVQTKFAFFLSNMDQLNPQILRSKGIFFKQGEPLQPGQMAILFPGQASQYLNMLKPLHDRFDQVTQTFQQADAFWFTRRQRTVSQLIYRPDDDPEALENLKQTQHAHPAIFVSSLSIYQLLRNLGFKARYMIGHSLGEITALAAAEKLSFEEALQLVYERGYAFHEAGLNDTGKMISILATRDQVAKLVKESGLEVSIANINSPKQIIVAGASEAIDQFKKFLDTKRVTNKLLFVSHAFHSTLMEPVAQRFFDKIRRMTFRKSDVKVIMNHSGNFYPDDAKAMARIPRLLRDQILQPVNFVRSIEKLYEQGVRLFVEVGPNAVLSNLCKDILKDREAEVSILASNYKNADDWESLQKLIAALFAEGVAVKPPVWSKAALSSGMPAQTTSLRAETVQPAAKTVTESAGQSPSVSVVYSGVSVGLPGSYKNAFRDDNFEQIFEGRNFIERLTDDEKQQLVDLQITKLVKEAQGPTFKLLSSLDEVIQLAGKVGKIDMIRDYHIDEKELQNMTSCIALGIAAGYEALKDAHIPLVREYMRTSTGKLLPQKLALPREMQDETGVIFANGFPMIDPVIEEVSRNISYHYGSKTRKELMAFYEAIIERVNNQDARKLLTDWYTLFYQRLKPEPDVAEVYQFNYHFMNQISAQANNRLASSINARGPNFQMNAACSSTSNAISIAEDFIRSGRVKRMIVIGADDPTSPTNFRWLGAGFLCTGAATNEGDLYRAAIPFDRRRNGMIISAGAVGVVLEAKSEVQKRGVVEVCELLGSHAFNTAGHPSQIDARQFAEQLDRFMARMETQHQFKRDELSRQLLYLSHETYTPPRGGCSQTEAEALKRIFPAGFQHIIVGNTKGMTGHAMGASLEDAVAAKALQYGKVPPVVNLSETDPMFEGLNLSRGGRHDRRFALKMSAGFGSQGHFVLLKKAAEGDHRIVDNSTYLQWLKQVSGDERVSTEAAGRLLVIKDNQQGQEIADSRLTGTASPAPRPTMETKSQKVTPALQAPDKKSLPAAIIRTISEITEYPEEMLETDMELIADLGISADKQEAILQNLGQKYGLEPARIQLPEEATVGQVIHAITRLLDTVSDQQPTAAVAPAPAGSGGKADKESIKAETLKVFSEITKYPEDMLDLDMEMEADLGIDTVKQATILSILGEKYMLQRDDSIQLSNYPTIGHIIDLVYEKAGTGVMPPPETEPETETESVEKSLPPQVTAVDDAKEAIRQETLKVFSEITKYPEDMLDLDMEMEADLGIDTVKQATILSILGEKYQLQREDDMQLSNYPTIGHIVDLLYEKGMAVSKAPAMTVSIAGTPVEVAETVSEESAPLTLSSLSRQVPVLVEEPLGKKEFSLANKKFWLIGSNEAILKRMAGIFRKKKAAVQMFLFQPGITAEELQQSIADFTKDQAADVIIDATHIGQPVHLPDIPDNKVNEWLFLNGTARFLFYQHLAESKKHPQKILCLTAMDGFMGLSDDQDKRPDPAFGALGGFYKGLRKEWPDCSVKIIDLDPLGLDEDGFMNPVIAEIEKAGPGVEIAYGQGKRQVIKIDDRELLARASLSFTEKDTILISGAGTGIAAEVTKALAQKYAANFVILDIIALPDNIEVLAGLDDAGLQDVKEKIRQQLQEKHRKVTPVMLNSEYEKITKAVEVHRNLNALKGLGRKVEYIQADIRDYEQMKEALAAVKKKLPKISALIHAAGVEKSHLLEQKSPAEFELVFGVKVLGALNLMRLCRDEPLKLVVAFSSISGRFGNAAQLDYSAANSFLNHWIRFMHKSRENLHALALIWSGWKDVGMAWRNEFVRQKAEEMGLHYIEIAEGIQAFLGEIENISADREVLLHKGIAHFVETGLAVSDLSPFPLIDRVIKSNDRIDKAFRVFSVKRDALIDQHRLGKVPILPAVAYSELAAEYFALQAGKKDHYLIRKLTFANAFKLFHEQPRELYIQGNPLDDGDSWKIEIKSDFKLPKANQVQTVLHSECIVSAEAPDYSEMNPENWELAQDGLIRLPADESLLLIKSSGPDQRIILGPLYNDVVRDAAAKEPVLIYPDSTIYPTYFPQEQLTNAKYPLQLLLTNPCFLDSIYQACAAHLLVNKKRVYLPWEVEELGIIRVPRQPGLYKSYTKVIADTDDRVTFQVSMVDGNGQICYYAKKATFHKINL